MIPTPGELLQRLGVDPAGAIAEELPHNRWLSPGVWRIRTGSGQRAALKYTQSGRSRGETPWDAHWMAGDLDPRRWTYWRREPLAYQYGLPGAYAGSGITAPAYLGAHVGDTEAALLLEWPMACRASSGRSRGTARPPRRWAGRRRRSRSAARCRRCPG